MERGEFDHQQAWRMTLGKGGVNLTASRGVEYDCWVERG